MICSKCKEPVVLDASGEMHHTCTNTETTVASALVCGNCGRKWDTAADALHSTHYCQRTTFGIIQP